MNRQEIVERAKALAAEKKTWADLSNALFDPTTGLISTLFSSAEQRRAFLKTPEYAAIRQILKEAVERTGLVDGAVPLEKSGKFNLRLPKSLHAALDVEAEREGVSLNQLVVTKLAAQLQRLAVSNAPEMAALAQAYLEVRQGYSIDRVVLDPPLNRAFLNRARDLGVRGADADINWKLFTGRKNKYFRELPDTKNWSARRKDEFEFASEMALRALQDQVRSREGRDISLDRAFCDPDLAHEFDLLASRLAPGFTPFEYRWVAMGIRKAAGRFRKDAEQISPPRFEEFGSTKDVKASRLPQEQGLYIFRCEDQPLFIGETNNLRERIERHREGSKHLGIPEWLYDSGKRRITLGLYETPSISAVDRKKIELRAVFNELPRFNYVATKAA